MEAYCSFQIEGTSCLLSPYEVSSEAKCKTAWLIVQPPLGKLMEVGWSSKNTRNDEIKGSFLLFLILIAKKKLCNSLGTR